MSTDPQELDKAAHLILQYCEMNHIGLKSNSSTTSDAQISGASSSKEKLSKVEDNKASFLLNKFLKTCGIKETITATKIVNIQQTYAVKEQLSFYVTNVKKIPDFQKFWNKYGEQLPDLERLVKHFSSMQATSCSSESSFSISGYINRKNRCSLSPSALRFSMCLKNHYELARSKV